MIVVVICVMWSILLVSSNTNVKMGFPPKPPKIPRESLKLSDLKEISNYMAKLYKGLPHAMNKNVPPWHDSVKGNEVFNFIRRMELNKFDHGRLIEGPRKSVFDTLCNMNGRIYFNKLWQGKIIIPNSPGEGDAMRLVNGLFQRVELKKKLGIKFFGIPYIKKLLADCREQGIDTVALDVSDISTDQQIQQLNEIYNDYELLSQTWDGHLVIIQDCWVSTENILSMWS